MDNDSQGPEEKKDASVGPPPEAPDPEAEKAFLLERVRRIVEQTPEVRPEKVAAVKEALERGTYRIDSRKLANILLAEWLSRR